jgi:hypothetical protein
MVREAIGDGEVEFIPAGLSYALKKPRSFFRKNPRSEVLLLAGVHPNCESFTILVSDGKRYRGVNHYITKPMSKAAAEFVDIAQSILPRLEKLDSGKFFQRLRGQLICIRAFAPWILRTVNFKAVTGGHPITGMIKAAWSGIFRQPTPDGSKSRRPRRVLRVAMLPFEEQHSIDAERLRSCKAVFAYEDTDDGKVKYFPACAWYPYRNPLLEKISRKYGVAGGAGE